MDLIAALALVLVLEGLALAILATSLPALMADLQNIGPSLSRQIGFVMVALGSVLYVLVRG
ncbi:MAG: DUF2065 family protein [Pseudomonadota bacterium]